MTFDRRQFLGYCAGSVAIGHRVAWGGMVAPGRLAFRLKEGAGLRRFGYPVQATLPGHPRDETTRYRLLRQGKEVPAQFRPIGPEGVLLAFNASPGPFEAVDYAVEFGGAAGPEPKGGLSAHRDAGLFSIRNEGHLTYGIPDDLAGLVASVSSGDLEYFEPHSRGLFLTERESRSRTPLKLGGVGDWRWRGPISVGLQFAGTIPMPGGKPLRTVALLNFVNSKSWIETTWTIEDPEDRVGSMGFDLGLLIRGEPALIDCGAGSTVYSHLGRGEVLAFEGIPHPGPVNARPRWRIDQGTKSGLAPFAVASDADRAAEGWVHVMDRERCSAIAVADFAARGPDRFTIEAGGRVELERRFTVPAAQPSKTLKFWIHVVPMPVQVGAVTSPQAMLAPLIVEWGKGS